MSVVKIKKAFTVSDEIWVKAKPQQVFSALTDEKVLAKWWPKKAETDPRKGGQVMMEWFNGGTLFSQYSDFVKDKEIGLAFYGDYLTFTLTRKKGGTHVLVEHTCSANKSLDNYIGVAQSWASQLCNLKAWLEKKWDMRPR